MKKTNNTALTIKEDKLLQFITSPKYRYLRHISAVLLLLLLMWAVKQPGEFYGIIDHIDWILSFSTILVLFYINLYLLVPRTLYQGKLIKYFLSLCLVIFIACIILYAIHYLFIEDYRVKPLEGNYTLLKLTAVLAIFLMLMVLCSTPLKMFQRWLDDTKRINKLEIKAVESELEALRNQIHPHFLFNMLNNINTLTKRDPELASRIIIKLSDFLRHLLYDTDQYDIYLFAEIRFLKDYLSLEEMRKDNFKFSVNYRENDIKGVKIPKNILLILVENAIKHGADPIESSYVNLNFWIEDGNFCFHIVNSVPKTGNSRKNGNGIGLYNIRRRLELLYGENFYINTNINKFEYIVTLKFPV